MNWTGGSFDWNQARAFLMFVGSADASSYIAALAKKGCTIAADQFKIITESGVVGWEMIKRGLELHTSRRIRLVFALLAEELR